MMRTTLATLVAAYGITAEFTKLTQSKIDEYSVQFDEIITSGITLDVIFARESKSRMIACSCMPDQLLDDLKARFESFKSAKVNCLSGKECNVPIFLTGIYHYGCWCNFGKDLMEGRGPVQNAHDEICQRMQFCLRCAKMDGQDEGESCDPPAQTYQATFNINNSKNKLATACHKKNSNNNCGARVCTCELGMIGDLVALIWTGYTYDPAPAHPKIGGTFDYEAECPPTERQITDLDCCGKYPARYPYNTNSSKACCNGNIYSELSQQCCDKNVVDLGEAC